VSLLLGALSLVCSIILLLLESVISHAGSLIAFLVARGAHQDAFGSGHPVSLSWGIPVLATASFLLMLVCIAGLFGRFSHRSPLLGHDQFTPKPSSRSASPADLSDADLFET
jgi:hypothetical protein